MRINIYTLDKENLVYLDKYIPEKIVNNTGEKGYYTLGAVCLNGTSAHLAGVAQFFVDSEKDGTSYAQLIYVYVADRYRRQSLGFRMIDKAGSILTTADVDVFKASVPPESPDETLSNLTGDELKSFLTECGFITYGEKQNALIRFTGRDYVSDITASGRNDILRINDGEGAHITFRMREHDADILGIEVPDLHRRQGIATQLFRSAEAIFSYRGIRSVSACFPDSSDGVGDLLSAVGFDIAESSEILSVDCNDLSDDNPALDRLKRHKVPGAVVMKLSFCDIHDLQGMMRFLNENGEKISGFDLSHMHKEISTIIFDMKGTICAVLLGSVKDGTVYVEHLIGLPGESNRRYTQAAIQNLIRTVLTNEESTAYDRVLFAVSDPGMQAFAEEIAQTGLKPVTADHCRIATKNVSRHPEKAGMPAATMIEKDMGYEWIRELAHMPMQRIISEGRFR